MKLLFYRVYEIYKYHKIANDYSSIQFNSLVNRSITIKNVLATLKVQPQVKTVFVKTAERLFHPTYHAKTHL